MDDTAIIKEPPKRPPGYYGRIGKLGGIVLREQRGKGYLRHIGGHGGRTTKARQEPGYYARIGRKGSKARNARWLAAKKAEAAND
jgi:hypothetical protein